MADKETSNTNNEGKGGSKGHTQHEKGDSCTETKEEEKTEQSVKDLKLSLSTTVINATQEDDKEEEKDQQKSKTTTTTTTTSMAQLKAWKRRMWYSEIRDTQLAQIIKSKDTKDKLVIVDVRKTEQDYLGGHINGSLNMQYEDFHNHVAALINDHHHKNYIVFHCMYSQV